MRISPEGTVLALALVCGVLYFAVVPPWQHYDEPTHFEYAWLIANRLILPRPGDYDQAMRREVAASMLEHDFFRGLGFRPNLLAQDKPVWIGLSELHHPPFYYLLVALPLRLIRYADVTFQLYVARSVSLVLYLLSIWVAGRLMGELVARGNPLRWAVPATVALLPAYTDLMTAVNNDVGAVVVFSLFLWGAVRIILRGVSWPRLIWVLGTAVLCAWTKNTAAVALLLAPLALILALRPLGCAVGEPVEPQNRQAQDTALVRGRWDRWAWAGVALAGILVVVVSFSWGDAALWYRDTAQEVPTSRDAETAPLGQHVLALEMAAEESGRQVNQPLLQEDMEALRGQVVTLGAWMWATRPLPARSPMLYDGRQHTWQAVELGTAPAFQAITVTVSADAKQVEVILRPLLEREQEGVVTVYYDGVVLVEGEWPLERAPLFNDPEGREGTWGGRPFVNRVRNGSAETAWPRVRPWVEEALRKYTRRSPTQFLVSVLDWQRTAWVYRVAGLNLFQSFWARFGWNHIGLPGGWYWGLGVVTALGVAGALVALGRLWRAGSPLPRKRAILLLAVAGLLVWGNALLRPHPLIGTSFIPAARYAYPAIIPTVLALATGWLAWAPQRAGKWAAVGLLTGLALLDVVSLVTISTFYGR